MDPVHPYMLVDGDQEAMEFARWPGTYDDTHTGDEIYEEGDLVFINSSGKVAKAASATAATVAAMQLYLAGQSWDQPFAKQYLLDKGVPLNVIPKRNRFVFTYTGNASAGVPYTFAAGDLLAVQQGAAKEILFDATYGMLVVRSSTTNPKCILKGVFKGGVNDANVRVLVELLPEPQ